MLAGWLIASHQRFQWTKTELSYLQRYPDRTLKLQALCQTQNLANLEIPLPTAGDSVATVSFDVSKAWNDAPKPADPDSVTREVCFSFDRPTNGGPLPVIHGQPLIIRKVSSAFANPLEIEARRHLFKSGLGIPFYGCQYHKASEEVYFIQAKSTYLMGSKEVIKTFMSLTPLKRWENYAFLALQLLEISKIRILHNDVRLASIEIGDQDRRLYLTGFEFAQPIGVPLELNTRTIFTSPRLGRNKDPQGKEPNAQIWDDLYSLGVTAGFLESRNDNGLILSIRGPDSKDESSGRVIHYSCLSPLPGLECYEIISANSQEFFRQTGVPSLFQNKSASKTNLVGLLEQVISGMEPELPFEKLQRIIQQFQTDLPQIFKTYRQKTGELDSIHRVLPVPQATCPRYPPDDQVNDEGEANVNTKRLQRVLEPNKKKIVV